MMLAHAIAWPCRLAQVEDRWSCWKQWKHRGHRVYTSVTVLGLNYRSPWPISTCSLLINMWPPLAGESQAGRSSWSPTNSSEHSNLITHFDKGSSPIADSLVQACSSNQWQGVVAADNAMRAVGPSPEPEGMWAVVMSQCASDPMQDG